MSGALRNQKIIDKLITKINFKNIQFLKTIFLYFEKSNMKTEINDSKYKRTNLFEKIKLFNLGIIHSAPSGYSLGKFLM